MILDPIIWGPHYWFVLHTIALTYPLYPNETSKKKYYDFVENIPLFIPIENISNQFTKLLDEFPVTPYLDSRESFIKWVHFIHNKINASLNIPEKTLEDSLYSYFKLYEKPKNNSKKILISREKLFFIFLIFFLIFLSITFYKK